MKKPAKRCSIMIAAAASIVLLLFSFVCLQASLQAYADDSYTTSNFNVDIIASEDNSFTVSEKIDVDFIYPHHGIFRYIPTNGIRISDISVPGYSYDVRTRDVHKVIKIGDADISLSGPQTYEVSYRMAFYDDEDKALDRLALNVIPTGWETQIDHASATITLPEAADLSKARIYSGEYGDEGNTDNVQLTASGRGWLPV